MDDGSVGYAVQDFNFVEDVSLGFDLLCSCDCPIPFAPWFALSFICLLFLRGCIKN